MGMQKDYELLDSGEGYKLERFGAYVLARPCSQAVWKRTLSPKIWHKADATFTRTEDNRWSRRGDLPEQWTMETEGIKFKLSLTDFGHLGIFAEQRDSWAWIQERLKKAKRPRVLNLFAYSGGSTMAAAIAGSHVCHLDASKGMVSWARENAKLNNLEEAPIRWIVEDVQKFIEREIRRESRYDAIILDPPSFGRGSKNELFKIENHIIPLLEGVRKLLTPEPLFVLFSCHTPGFTPTVLSQLLQQCLEGLGGSIEQGEMLLTGTPFSIPSGAFARWYT
ncbi:MAG: class I SAM-dependent methyltransferase [Verrucomicrobia bacterium]|nr:class I SAM-dependent methyltransferase [Verrucomicrobiota bacterium]